MQLALGGENLMSRLQVFLNETLVKEVDLQTQGEWTLGRSSSCDILLEGSPEISRQHLKISLQSGVWVVEVLSRYGHLYNQGNKVSSLELKGQVEFEAPPFAFVYTDNSAVAVHEPSHDHSDKTYVGQTASVPYIKVCNENGDTVHNFRLDGNYWLAGRDSGCTLFIDHVKFSRRHFEIRVEEGAYMVRDLGSSNGTFLNENALISQEWVPFRSGDVLTVVDWKLYFELRDSKYEERLQGVSDELRHPLTVMEGLQMAEAEFPQSAIGAMPTPPPKPVKKKVNWVRMVIGLILIGGAVGYLMDGGEKPPEVAQTNKTNGSAFDKLSPKQQQYVKDTYRLADRLFKEGRYEMARQEVAKIHQVIPSYEESKNLEKLAEVAIQTQLDQARAEAQEKEKLEMDEKIRQTVELCRRKISSKIEVRTIDDCLSPVIALNPEHPDILALKARVDQIVAERMQSQERKAEYQALVRRQKALYEKAVALSKSGKPLEALEAYGNVVQSKLPDPENLKNESKREIASIQTKLAAQQGELETAADSLYKKGNLKNAISTLKKAIEINPENEVVKGRINSMLGELKKQMQVMYQEGVLEESVGEVETAKTKWKKIIELSLPEEDYYKKARTKLKKYEAE
jgi:pSer/pThr/pTyr-binding forkhead associated (FHA) protein